MILLVSQDAHTQQDTTESSTAISVATLNLLRDLDRWDERKGLIVDEFQRLQPDLIALQEVALAIDNAHWLAEQLGGYSVHMQAKTGKKCSKVEAIAILSRLPVQHTHWLDLRTQNRVALAVQTEIQGAPLLFVSGHFYWFPGDHSHRTRQLQLLKSWLYTLAHNSPQTSMIVCGDFNGTPDMSSLQVMREGFESAHVAHHGHEPDWTCPTPLPFQRTPWRKMVFQVAGLATQKEFKPWRGTLDYIFVNRHVLVEECHVAFDQPALHDAGLFASDHLGLSARVKIGN